MRIKQLHVTRYGPMAPFVNDDLGTFTLIHGPNERGKTLLIDALVRMLFKKDLRKPYRRHFGTGGRDMNRVTERPEGFVVLESRGEIHKLEATESVKDVFSFDAVPEDFRNVFVVRDSDLSLKDEDKYYSRVTEKLTGLRSSEIERLVLSIQKRGRLRSASPDSGLANSADQGKIAEKVRDARFLIEEIRSLKESLLAEKFDELEHEMIRVRDRLSVLARDAELQRNAEETMRFNKARGALDDLVRLTKQIETLGVIDSEQLKQWQRAVTRRETLAADVKDEKNEVDKIERAIRNSRRAVAELEARAAEAAEKLSRINAELRPRIDDYQYERAEFSRAEPQSGTYRRGLYAAAGITALALAGFIVHKSWVVAGVAVAALFVWLFTGYKQLKLRQAEGRLRSKTDRLLEDIKHCGIKIESVDEVMSTIGDIERDVLRLQEDSRARRSEFDNIVKEKERIEGRVSAKTEQVAELDGELAALQVATRMESLAEYQAALEKRTRAEATVDARRTLLSDMLPGELGGDEAVADWENRIEAHTQLAAEREQVDFDAEVFKRINGETEKLKERKRQIHDALEYGTRKLHGVEVKAKEAGILEASPPCRSTQELDHIGAMIGDFCERIERDQRVAQDAIRLCEKIEDEERARVSDLFGPDSPVTGYMSAITGGRYVSVDYDAGQNHVYLTAADGTRVRADALSGGAYDQLYLSIRISIASRLLADETGFLVLDDPFVKADSERLATMMDTLRGLAADGWQIIYFSAKDEVLHALAGDIREGRVQQVFIEAPAHRGIH